MFRRAVLVLALPLSAVACDLPVDEQVSRLDEDEIPPDIGEPTTTTTTTTSTTTTVASPPSTDAGDEPPSSTTSSTVALVATEPVNVFYTRGFTTDLVALHLDLAAPVQIAFIVDWLENTTDLENVPNLRTSVRRGLIVVEEIVVERGVATIPLDPVILGRMSDPAVDRAIAQIVLTFTSFRTPDQGNVGAVRFEVDGEGFPVFVPAGGGSSEPGEPLAYTDFAQLILTTPVPAATTPPPPATAPRPAATTTTTTTDTTPPTDTDPPATTAPDGAATTTTTTTTTTPTTATTTTTTTEP